MSCAMGYNAIVRRSREDYLHWLPEVSRLLLRIVLQHIKRLDRGMRQPPVRIPIVNASQYYRF